MRFFKIQNHHLKKQFARLKIPSIKMKRRFIILIVNVETAILNIANIDINDFS